MTRLVVACLLLLQLAVRLWAAEGISADTRAWLDDTLVVLMTDKYTLEHAREVISSVQPDLMDWHFGIYTNIGDVYRRHGVRVSGGAWQREYQEYVTWYDRDWRLRMQQFETNGVGRLPDGSPVWDSRSRYCASMCHNAPKWHLWHNQGLLMPVPYADTISQDNIDVAGFAFGRGAFCKWCLRGFRQYLRRRFDTATLRKMGVPDLEQFDFAAYLQTKHPKRGPTVLEDPLCREYVKYQHCSMLDAWRDVCRKVRQEAARQGLPIPPIYGNQYAAQRIGFGLHQSTEVDVVWIEDELCLPTRGDNQAWSTLRYKVGLAAGGRGQPVWSCVYPGSEDERLVVLAEALANGGVHVANAPSPLFAKFAAFVRENRHLFTRRQRLARVGLIASPTTWMWSQFPEMGLSEQRTRNLFSAAARALEENHVPYGVVVFHHPAVVDERPCLAELGKYQVMVAAGVECLSAAQEAMLKQFVAGGGRLVVVGDFGKYDEDYVARKPPDLPAERMSAAQVEALLSKSGERPDISAARRALAEAVAKDLMSERLVETDAGPLLWVNLWLQRGRRLDVHLVNYEMSAGNLVPVKGFEMTVAVPQVLATPSAWITGPYLERQRIALRREGNLVHFSVPAFKSYAIVSLGEEAEMEAARQLAIASKAVDRLRAAREPDRAKRFSDALAMVEQQYQAHAYPNLTATARQVTEAAEKALAESVDRKEKADAQERLARVASGRKAALALDFGLQPTEGWQQVTEKTVYDRQRGFGWLIADGLLSAGGGVPDSLHGDWITSEEPRTLRVDVKPGTYRVTLITGEMNESYHWGGDVEATANGKIMLVGIKRRGGFWRSNEFFAEAPAGSLELTFSSRPAWWPMTYEHKWSVAGLIIEQAPQMPPQPTLPLTEWLVSGPYDDHDWTGIDAAEKLPTGRAWHTYRTRPGGVPIVDFRHLFTADDEAIFAAKTALLAPRALQVTLHIGLQARGKVWLNGKLILHDEKASGLSIDEYTLPVFLAAGWNVLEVLTSTDWIGASFTASLSGADGVRISTAYLPEAQGAAPVAEYPEPVLVCDQPALTLGLPMEVSVHFENLSVQATPVVLSLAAPENAEEVQITPLEGQQVKALAAGETAVGRFCVLMTKPLDTVDRWHRWSVDVPDRVKMVASARCGEQVRHGYRWLPALSPHLQATMIRPATQKAAELKVELTNPTGQPVVGKLSLQAPAGWQVTQMPVETLRAEPSGSATTKAVLWPGGGVLPGEYPVHVTFLFQPVAGKPIALMVHPVVVLVGISGQWRFDEGAGTLAADSSPNHNDGKVRPGLQWVEGRRGKALRFGGQAWVEVTHCDSLSITSGVTLEAWIKPETFVGNDIIVVKTDYSNEYLLYVDRQGTLYGRVRCGGVGGRNEDMIKAPGVLKTGVWQHIAFTWDRQFMRLYLNGRILMVARTQCMGIGKNSSPLCIGGGAYSGGFHGVIDEVIVRTGALSPEEIQANYEQFR